MGHHRLINFGNHSKEHRCILWCFRWAIDSAKAPRFHRRQQSAFIKQLKECIRPGQVIVIADVAESYLFVSQDSAQGFHWNNAQTTVHPFVIYYKRDSDLAHINFVVISECLTHNTVAVHAFQKKLFALFASKMFRVVKFIISRMVRRLSTKIGNISWIWPITQQIFVLMLSGTSSPGHMARGHAMELEGRLNGWLVELVSGVRTKIKSWNRNSYTNGSIRILYNVGGVRAQKQSRPNVGGTDRRSKSVLPTGHR